MTTVYLSVSQSLVSSRPKMPRDIRQDNTTTPTDPVMEIVAYNTAHEEIEQLHEEHDNTSIL